MESKIIATVDAKLNEFDLKMASKAADTERWLDSKLRQIEEEFCNSLNKLDTEVDNRLMEVERTQSTVSHEDAESRIDHLERMSRSNELTISDIPRTENEDVNVLCSRICDAIGFNGKNSIQTCFRVPSKSIKASRSSPPSVIVKFWSSDAKIGFFKSYISTKNLCVTDIGFAAPARIYT